MVVIAIIAILGSFLLPALGRAREKARRAACLSKQKQVVLAARVYANDNDSRLLKEYDVPGTTADWAHSPDGWQRDHLFATMQKNICSQKESHIL